MARLLPTKAIPEFLDAYGVTAFGGDCPPEKLTVKVWDKYGTVPEDQDNAPGVGQFVAAVVFCDECSKDVQLHRDQLEKG